MPNSSPCRGTGEPLKVPLLLCVRLAAPKFIDDAEHECSHAAVRSLRLDELSPLTLSADFVE